MDIPAEMTNKRTESFYSKVHRLLAEGNVICSPLGDQVLGCYDNGASVVLVVLIRTNNGFELQFENPFSRTVFDANGNPF